MVIEMNVCVEEVKVCVVVGENECVFDNDKVWRGWDGCGFDSVGIRY